VCKEEYFTTPLPSTPTWSHTKPGLSPHLHSSGLFWLVLVSNNWSTGKILNWPEVTSGFYLHERTKNSGSCAVRKLFPSRSLFLWTTKALPSPLYTILTLRDQRTVEFLMDNESCVQLWLCALSLITLWALRYKLPTPSDIWCFFGIPKILKRKLSKVLAFKKYTRKALNFRKSWSVQF
jgi:hypothetical protein